MLLYSTLFLAQVRQLDAEGNPTNEPAVSLEEIERFRQLGSKTPGHPEYGHTSGVELTTGPLGQGIGWSVLHVADANDTAALDEALSVAAAAKGSPTLIIVRSHIGYGAPNKQDTKEAHGEALGEADVEGAKRAYGWPPDRTFYVPEGAKERFAQGIGARGAGLFAG